MNTIWKNLARALVSRCVATALVVVAMTVAARGDVLQRTPEMKDIWRPAGVEYGLDVVGYSPDGTLLAVAGYQQENREERVRLWQFGSDANRKSLEVPKGLKFSNYNEQDNVVFSPDGALICGYTTSGSKGIGEWVVNPTTRRWETSTGDAKTSVKLLVWDAKTGKLLCSSQPPDGVFEKVLLQVRHLAWTLSGPSLVLVGREHAKEEEKEPCRILFWDTSQAREGKCSLARALTLDDSTGRDLSIAISRDGSKIAGGALENMWLWDAANGDVLRTFSNPDKNRFNSPYGYGYPHDALIFSPDDALLMSHAALGRSGAARLWDTQSGRTWKLEESEGVRPAAFSPDGTLIAGGSLRLWDAQSGKLLGGADVPVRSQQDKDSLAFWPDAASIASGDNALVLWDVEKLRRLQGRIVKMPSTGAPAIQPFEGDVAAIANNYGYAIKRVPVRVEKAGEKPHSVLIWQVRQSRTEKSVGMLPADIYNGEPERAVISIAPGGKIVAVMDWESQTGNALILLWDVMSSRALPPLRVPKEEVQSMRFSPDGALLATSSGDRRVRLWNVRQARLLRIFPVGKGGYLMGSDGGRDQSSGALAFSPDGKTLALPSATMGAPIVLWDVKSGKALRALRSRDQVGVASIAFSPDGRFLAAGGAPMRLWDLQTGRLRRAYQGYDSGSGYLTDASPRTVAFETQGKALFVLTASESSNSNRWDVSWLRRPPQEKPIRALDNPVALPDTKGDSRLELSDAGHLFFSPDGRSLAAPGVKGVNLWDVASGKRSHTLPGANPWGFSPDGRRVYLEDKASRDFVFETATGRQMPLPEGMHQGTLISLRAARSADGVELKEPIQFRQTSVPAWSVRGSRMMRDWVKYPEWLQTLEFTADGKTMAADIGGAIVVWDVATGERRYMASVGDAQWSDLAFSPDGRVLAGANILGFVHLWDAASGAWLRTLSGHTGAITDITFSPDGQSVASAGEDYTARLWDVATGRETRLFEGHANTVMSVAFSPDGRTLATGSYDGKILLWRASAFMR